MDRLLHLLRSRNPFQRAWKVLQGKLFFVLPAGVRQRLYAGRQHQCPLCGQQVRAFPRFYQNYHWWCPVCASLQRHRLVWLFLTRRGLLPATQAKARLLHIAPEPALEVQFRRLPGITYLSADLHDPRAMVRMDITQIQYPADAFDIVYCSHVLEHVPDDRRAMAEFFRVLSPGGWAVILSPITAPQTIEDPTLTDSLERERRFGQHDHVRRYGWDIEDRLQAAGFVVEITRSEDFLSAEEIQRYGVKPGEAIFLCRKPN